MLTINITANSSSTSLIKNIGADFVGYKEHSLLAILLPHLFKTFSEQESFVKGESYKINFEGNPLKIVLNRNIYIPSQQEARPVFYVYTHDNDMSVPNIFEGENNSAEIVLKKREIQELPAVISKIQGLSVNKDYKAAKESLEEQIKITANDNIFIPFAKKINEGINGIVSDEKEDITILQATRFLNATTGVLKNQDMFSLATFSTEASPFLKPGSAKKELFASAVFAFGVVAAFSVAAVAVSAVTGGIPLLVGLGSLALYGIAAAAATTVVPLLAVSGLFARKAAINQNPIVLNDPKKLEESIRFNQKS